MNKIAKLFSATCLLPLLCSGNVIAQEEDALQFVPVEIFTCNYNKGRDYDDLQRVTDKWNKWADDNFPVPYTAWIMTPNFFGAEQDFDVIWLGAWQNGKDMGAGLAAWNSASGAAMNDEFNKVVDCDTHANFGSLNIKPPSANWPGESGVALFYDCKVAEGKSMQDAIAAHRRIAEVVSSQGSKAGSWMWFPGYGGGGVDFSYKLVVGHDDYQSVGNDWESYSNGGGYMKRVEAAGGTMMCDNPRVYTSRTVRDGGITSN